MEIKTLLVPVSGQVDVREPLESALRLARSFQAHVEALHVSVDPRESVAYLSEGMPGSMIESVMEATEQEAGQRAARAKKLFDDLCDSSGTQIMAAPRTSSSVVGAATAHFHLEVGQESEFIGVRGRLADLIVLAQPQPDIPSFGSAAVHAALTDTGRPVLILPATDDGAGLMEVSWKKIAIFWNGSAEAARAVGYSLAFLKEADEIVIMIIDEHNNRTEMVDDLVDYLAWHGVNAVSKVVLPEEMSAGGALLSESEAFGADLLVTGAYTHSRLRRLIFGGVTGIVLDNSDIPVLMAH